MKYKTIKSEYEYEATLARIAKLMDAKVGTPDGAELQTLSKLVYDYEERSFPLQSSAKAAPPKNR
jgi:HTH-type transcriptional regulator/antitoxin HigA